MKRTANQLALLLLCVTILASCGGNSDVTVSETTEEKRISTIDEALKQAGTPEALITDSAATLPLNRKLATRMTFGEPDEIIALLKNGATPEAKNRYGLPVIFLAAERGDVTILEAVSYTHLRAHET